MIEELVVPKPQHRICVMCGKSVDASKYKRGDILPECVKLLDGDEYACCTFDLTDREAFEHWEKIAYDRQKENSILHSRVKVLQQLIAEIVDLWDGPIAARRPDILQLLISQAAAALDKNQ